MSEIPGALREAYVRDVIDLETFERFAGYFVADQPCALPQEVFDLARELATLDDKPGRIHFYNPVAA